MDDRPDLPPPVYAEQAPLSDLRDWLAPAARRMATSQAGVMAKTLKDAGLIIPWRHAEAATMRRLDRTDSGLALLH